MVKLCVNQVMEAEVPNVTQELYILIIFVSVTYSLMAFIFFLLPFQMISLLPSKIMKLLEFVGFSGSKVKSILSF